MSYRLQHRQAPLLLLIGALTLAIGGCATDPGHVPAAGSYQFDASWPVAGSSTPAAVTGTLTITSATADQLAYAITLHDVSGDVRKEGTATWDDGNGYVIVTGQVHQGGTWALLPHFKLGACYGNALNVGTAQGVPMTCHWQAP